VDTTGQIAEEAAWSNSWIKVIINRVDHGFRKAGRGVIDAFYEGYRLVENESWDYLVKLDGDLSFAKDYFERCFRSSTRILDWNHRGNDLQFHRRRCRRRIQDRSTFHVRGATKIYSAECWRAIGGLIHAPGWDTLDEVKQTCWAWSPALSGIKRFTIVRPALHMVNGVTWPRGCAQLHRGLSSAVYVLKEMYSPLGGKAVSTWGHRTVVWLHQRRYVKRVPVDDKALIRYFRQQQINRLLGRKSLWD
jgi:hypothetical protein